MYVTHNTEIPFNPVSSTVLLFLIDGWMNEYFDSQEPTIPDNCNFFYTGSIFEFQILHPKID